jgi:hypothetical protein
MEYDCNDYEGPASEVIAKRENVDPRGIIYLTTT